MVTGGLPGSSKRVNHVIPNPSPSVSFFGPSKRNATGRVSTWTEETKKIFQELFVDNEGAKISKNKQTKNGRNVHKIKAFQSLR